MAADAVPYRLDEHDRRLEGHHRRIGSIEVKNADQDRAINGLEHDVKEARSDVTKIEAAIEKSDEKRENEGSANRKALYVAASFMATFSVAIMGLIATLLGSH